MFDDDYQRIDTNQTNLFNTENKHCHAILRESSFSKAINYVKLKKIIGNHDRAATLGCCTFIAMLNVAFSKF